LGALEGDETTPVHIVPHEDLCEHITNESCWCKPKSDPNDLDSLWIHNSLDAVRGAKTRISHDA
jgi:hypothetical protein